MRGPCRKRPKIRLGLTYGYKRHDPELLEVGFWGPPHWRLYEATARCKCCGCTARVFGLTEDELMSAGVPVPKEKRGVM